jgi:hypothetical protein
LSSERRKSGRRPAEGAVARDGRDGKQPRNRNGGAVVAAGEGREAAPAACGPAAATRARFCDQNDSAHEDLYPQQRARQVGLTPKRFCAKPLKTFPASPKSLRLHTAYAPPPAPTHASTPASPAYAPTHASGPLMAVSEAPQPRFALRHAEAHT